MATPRFNQKLTDDDSRCLPCIRVDVRPDGVAIVAIHGSEARASIRTLTDLSEALDRVINDSFVRSIVIAPSGRDSFFSSDVEEIRALRSRSEASKLARARHDLLERLSGSKPVVAAVHGSATGIGFEIALACRGRVASADPKTKFALSDVSLGLAPALSGLQHLCDIIGWEQALDVAVSGRSLTVGEAATLGIVLEAIAPDCLVDRAVAYAQELVHAAQAATMGGAAWLNALVERRLLVRGRLSSAVSTWGRDAPQRIAMLRILEAHASDGVAAGRVVEREAFADLAVASGTHRAIDVAIATETLAREQAEHLGAFGRQEGIAARTGPFERRVLAAYLNEACWLVSEGSGVEHVERALIEWGFSIGPLERLDQQGHEATRSLLIELAASFGPRFEPAPFLVSLASEERAEPTLRRSIFRPKRTDVRATEHWALGLLRKRTPPKLRVEPWLHERLMLSYPDPSKPSVALEEIQMRCALRLVNEALYCLGEGVIASARDADVASVAGLGFPAFRGGVARYVDTVGAHVVLSRVRAFRKRFGQRYEPAPLLVELASRRGRLHPPNAS